MAVVEAAIDNRTLPAYAYSAGQDAYLAAASAAVPSGPNASRWGNAAMAQAATEPSLRQMVELFAEQNSLEFVPKSGRREQGLQVPALDISSSYLLMITSFTVMEACEVSGPQLLLASCGLFVYYAKAILCQVC